METITILDFAQKAASLTPGAELRFQVTNEDGEKMDYFITLVEHGESFCILANCQGGGDPFVFDITTYDANLKKLSEALEEYINGRSKVFGYVEFDGGKAADTENLRRHMLISVCERDICVCVYPTYDEAYFAMEKQLEETMSQNREEYEEDNDYAICETSAWSNANRNAKSDWLIVGLN